MKATICVQYGPPSTAFEYKENYAKPEITKPNQILIKNKFCSVNPADCKQRSGNLKLVLKHQFPFILCQDFAGVVVEVGKDVKKFQDFQSIRLDCASQTCISGRRKKRHLCVTGLM